MSNFALSLEYCFLHPEKEKLNDGFRYEIDKVTAAQRLDINLERG